MSDNANEAHKPTEAEQAKRKKAARDWLQSAYALKSASAKTALATAAAWEARITYIRELMRNRIHPSMLIKMRGAMSETDTAHEVADANQEKLTSVYNACVDAYFAAMTKATQEEIAEVLSADKGKQTLAMVNETIEALLDNATTQRGQADEKS